MKSVTIHDAKTNLSKYIAAAKAGTPVYIGSFGKAEVVLMLAPAKNKPGSKRDFSAAEGKITAKPDAFSAKTDQHIANIMLSSDPSEDR